jgi:hypothetical protein
MLNGALCHCDNTTIANKKFPYWCQLGWGSAKIISNDMFNLHRKVFFHILIKKLQTSVDPERRSYNSFFEFFF